MKRHTLRHLLLAAIGAATALADPAATIDASRWQLFIDNYAIARGTGFDRVVHRPQARGVVIDADRPWETHGVQPGFFYRKPDGTFVAYYSAIWWIPYTDARSATMAQVVYADGAWRTRAPDPRPQDRDQQYVAVGAFATSRDGIHWEKPNLGRLEAPAATDWKKYAPFPHPVGASRANNVDLPFSIHDLGGHGGVTDPAKRYALSLGGQTYFTAEVPDFIGDPDWRTKLTKADGTFSSRGGILSFWDADSREWVAMVQNTMPRWLPSRQIARFSSPDLKVWRSEIALLPDPADPHRPDAYDEPMGLVAFVDEGITFGILSWFHSDRTGPDGGPVMDPASPQMQGRTQGWPFPTTKENPFVWPWARKGTNDLRITISRDGGRTWDRTSSREAWVPHGTEEDSYDRLAIAPIPPVRVGDEDWFYVGVNDGDHLASRANAERTPYYRDRLRRGRIALYTQKHHRYVSLRANSQRETLITKPFVVTGDTLQLNVDGSRGRVR
ncbi:MAG: hypothetical protein JNG83_12675, partial [Opitutaceae bacterium]|nr:hypothetical protein [Opitutaceae bacterium]